MTKRSYLAQAGAPKTAQPAKPGWKCSHCQGKGKRRKVYFIRRSKRDVYAEVKAKVLAVRDRPKKWEGLQYWDQHWTKEQLAVELGVTEDCVVRAMRQLNIEGLVYQRVNKAPHDSKREYPDPSFSGKRYGDASWCGSTYGVRWPEDKETDNG